MPPSRDEFSTGFLNCAIETGAPYHIFQIFKFFLFIYIEEKGIFILLKPLIMAKK